MAESIRDRVTISIPSHPACLCMVRDVTARMAAAAGMSSETAEQVKLAVDEACSNVIKHAYIGDTTKRIIVKFRINRGSFEVTIDDTGLKADPESVKGRDLDDLKPGGLGVHFIKRVFDVFDFVPTKKKGNRLRLIKHKEKTYEY